MIAADRLILAMKRVIDHDNNRGYPAGYPLLFVSHKELYQLPYAPDNMRQMITIKLYGYTIHNTRPIDKICSRNIGCGVEVVYVF